MIRDGRGGLRLRLLLAFAVVAAATIGVFAVLTLDAARSDVASFVRRQQEATLRNTVGALADAYREAGTWWAADLLPARAVALSGGAVVEVRDRSGVLVLQGGGELGPAPPSGLWADPHLRGTFGPPHTARVVVAGELVGRASLRFPKSALPPPEQRLTAALTHTVLIGVAAATAITLAVALLVTASIARPLRRLTSAARRLRAGDRRARAHLVAPGELGELASAFDDMAEALEREDELRRTMTADVAHELRTPMTILIAHFEAMLDGVVAPSAEHIATLHGEAKRLASLIEDLGTLASAQAAGLTLDRQPVDVAEVVRQEAEVHALRFESAGVALTATVADGSVVHGDPRRLAQVVRNLLANALAYTPAGGRVEISVQADETSVAIDVVDSGIGIAAEDVPRVFERFWRGRSGRASDGSGIGLAVVQELVRAHGGTVGVASAPGEGSRFTVRLPRADAAAPRRQSPPALHLESADAAPPWGLTRS